MAQVDQSDGLFLDCGGALLVFRGGYLLDGDQCGAEQAEENGAKASVAGALPNGNVVRGETPLGEAGGLPGVLLKGVCDVLQLFAGPPFEVAFSGGDDEGEEAE